MKKLICGVLAAVCVTVPAFAAELSAGYDPVLKKYVVSGSVPEASQNRLVSVKVVSDEDNTTGWAGTLRAEDDGSFSESFVFAPLAQGGKYTVSIGIYEQGVVKTAQLFYVSSAQKQAALDAVNGAATTESLDKAITDNAVFLSLNIELYNSLGDAKQDVLEALLDGSFTEIEDFIIALETATAYALVKNADESNIVAVMEEYSSYFELEKSSLYTEFVKLDKTLVYKKMAGADCEDGETIRKVFDEATALTIINNTTKWNDFKTMLDTYIAYTGIDTEYYDKCDKSELATAICDTDYNTSAQLYDAIKAYYEGLGNSGGNNGGGGLGGSGGGGGSLGGGKTENNNTGLTLSGIGNQQNQSLTSMNNNLYSDLKDFDWAETAVAELTKKKIISGDGTGRFNPSNFVTKEEFVKMLVSAFELYTENAESDFSDVDKNDWAYPYISSAYSLGITKGTDEKTFGYGERISRQDMAVLIERAVKLDTSKKANVSFADIDEVSDYAKDSVIKMAKSGIINGYEDGTFRPMAKATRAEAAVMVYRLLSR